MQQHQKDVVALLLEVCADVDVSQLNAAGASALDLAEDLAFADVAVLLEGHPTADREDEEEAGDGSGTATAAAAGGSGGK